MDDGTAKISQQDTAENNGLNSVKNAVTPAEQLVKVVAVPLLDGKKANVLLSDAPFHLSGGGQPGDSGTLRGDGFRAQVLDARKSEGGVTLDLKLLEGKPEPGMKLFAAVDTARNALLSRMHTAQHIFSRIQEDLCEGLETEKVSITDSESTIYIHYDGELTWDSLFEAEEKTIAAIDAALPVETTVTTKESAAKIPELKVKWDRIHDEQVRVVKVAGLDATACAGTHVKNTSEIGGFLVSGYNGSAPEWEVRFTVLTSERIKYYSRVTRRLLRDVGCRPDQLEDVFLRQKAENASLKQTLDKVRGLITVPWVKYELGQLTLFMAVLPGLTKELISGAARACVAENRRDVCLALMPGAQDEPFQFILLRGSDCQTDLSSFLKTAPELQARGGGKADWLNGTSRQRDPAVWHDCIARFF